MLHTVEAIVHQNGEIELLEKIALAGSHRAIVTILDDNRLDQEAVTTLSEAALARDWTRPEEDEAWLHLQPGR